MDRKETIEVIREYYPSSDKDLNEALEILIPELKESEDERIRKAISQCVEDMRGQFEKLYSVHHKDAIAWLKKQGSQNLANSAKTCKDEPKSAHVDYISGIRKVLLNIENNAKNINGLTESQWVAIRAAHRLLGEYIAKEQNSAWSKEDEGMFNCLIATLCEEEHGGRETNDRFITWLKSLKERVQPQNTWKPSEEQMHYLSWIANIKLGDGVVEQEASKHLNELYNDLKKLKR